MDSRLFIDGEYILSQEGMTQGDPLAMPMYALDVVPLICQLAAIKVSQLWYADDASAGGSLCGLRSRWDRLVCLGPDYGYCPNAAKTCLIVKPTLLCQAKAIFHGSGVVITDSGKRHLGSAIGTPAFVEGFVQEKVATWVREMEKLSEVAVTQPQAAYTAFMHVFLHCWSYVARTIPWSPELFHPLDDVVSFRFLPAVTGRQAFGSVERELLSLPARLGGLGIVVPSIHLSSFYALSQKIAAPLIDKLLQQSPSCPLTIYDEMYQSKREVGASRRNDLITFARSFPERLSPSLRCSFEAASERGASCWLTTLPIAEHGFAMPKGERVSFAMLYV